MSKIIGGKVKKVKIITDTELKPNGGKYTVPNTPAIRVTKVSDDKSTNKHIAGSVTPVYVVDDDYISKHGITGGASLKVAEYSGDNIKITSSATAMPVYIDGETSVLTLYTTAQGAGQFTPTLTLSAGAPTPHWDFGDGTTFDGAAIDHNYANAGTKTVTITPFSVVDYIVNFLFDGCYLFGDIGGGIVKYISNITGAFYIYGSPNAYIRASELPLGGWGYIISGTKINGSLSDLPPNAYNYDFANTNITASAMFASDVIHYLYANNNNWTQSDVDTVIASIYANRANYTYATPTLNIGGNNAAPSGVYQYAATPTTGKEMIYALVNDPDGEGFNKWTITYTA